MLTGQLFFRDGGMRAPDGRRVMMVVGVVAVDDADTMLNERQCVVTGMEEDGTLALNVELPGVDLSADIEVASATLGTLLLRSMWRV